jgi:taurine dioxygenase
MTRSPRQSECSPTRSAPRCSASSAERRDRPTARAVRTGLLEHVVIFLRDQQLAPPQLLALAERFGGRRIPAGQGPAGRRAGAADHQRPHDRVNFGAIWHSDTAYLERAAHATGMATRAAVVKAADACGRRGSAP